MADANKCPCDSCKRVKNPDACTVRGTNTLAGCVAWQKWWVDRWDSMRQRFLRSCKVQISAAEYEALKEQARELTALKGGRPW